LDFLAKPFLKRKENPIFCGKSSMNNALKQSDCSVIIPYDELSFLRRQESIIKKLKLKLVEFFAPLPQAQDESS